MPAYLGSFYQPGNAVCLGKRAMVKVNCWRARVGLSTRYPSFVRLPAWPVTIIRLRRPCLRNRNGAKRSGNFWVMAGPPNTLIFNNGCLRPVTKITPERFPPQVRAHVYVPGIFPLCSQVLRGRLRILAPPVDAASSLRYTWPHSAMPVMAAFMVAEY